MPQNKPFPKMFHCPIHNKDYAVSSAQRETFRRLGEAMEKKPDGKSVLILDDRSDMPTETIYALLKHVGYDTSLVYGVIDGETSRDVKESDGGVCPSYPAKCETEVGK